METRQREFDGFSAWVAAAVVAAVALAGGMVLRPRAVFDRFLWQDFVGPLQAEAFGAQCAILLQGGAFRAVGTEACATAVAEGRLVAAAGATPVSAVGYAAGLLFLLLGGALLLKRLRLVDGRRFFYAVLPFLVLAGALLAVRDATAALPRGPAGLLGYPAGLLLTTPAVYALAVVLPVVALAVGAALQRRGRVERYEHVSTTVAVGLFGLAVGGVGSLAYRTEGMGLHLQGVPALLVATTALAIVTWLAVARVFPGVVARIGSMGLVVLWAYLLHGLVVVVAADWAAELGFAAARPVDGLVRVVADVTATALPASVAAVTKLAWPFLLLQVAVALVVAASFERELVREDELALLLLVAVFGVALVPAVHGLLRLAIGI
ncbi:DUF63 family protein [Halobium salinum]|uniref:DUF63 family protein n=1 Tax=Halobium salinum TaxID=1364940 RepID=A0ABD5PBR5_9EURY|nr:DUF63 family protein [Halobium salinum]